MLLRESAVSDDAASVNKGFGPKGNRELKLTVLSPRTAAPLWERPLDNVDPIGFLGRVVTSDWDWPLIVDLDGKEKTAIVVPFVDYKSHASGVELLDGGSGESRWKRPLARISQNWQPETYRVVAGPDLDGDGRRELFAASYDPRSGRVYVDALSGATGRILWSNQQIAAFPNQPGVLLPLRWWQPGSDGWPLLVVGQRNGADWARRTAARRYSPPPRAGSRRIDPLRPARGFRRQWRRPVGSCRLRSAHAGPAAARAGCGRSRACRRPPGGR